MINWAPGQCPHLLGSNRTQGLGPKSTPSHLCEQEPVLSNLSWIGRQSQGWRVLLPGPAGMFFLVPLSPGLCSPASPVPCTASGKTVMPHSLLAPLLVPLPSLPAALCSPQPSSNCAPWLTCPGSFVLEDLRRYSVDLSYTVFQTQGSVPTSTVIISEATGSRTILHAYRFVHLSAPCQLPPPLPPPPPPPPPSPNPTAGPSPRGPCAATPPPHWPG